MRFAYIVGPLALASAATARTPAGPSLLSRSESRLAIDCFIVGISAFSGHLVSLKFVAGCS